MELSAATKASSPYLQTIAEAYGQMMLHPTYRFWLLLTGAPVNLVVLLVHLYRRKTSPVLTLRAQVETELRAAGHYDRLVAEFEQQLIQKQRFFGQQPSKRETDREVVQRAESRFREIVNEEIAYRALENQTGEYRFTDTFRSLAKFPLFLLLSFIPGLLMYGLMLIYSSPFAKFVFERLVMAIFVILGVALVVFTILYLSPFDPAANILGETATPAQIQSFNSLYGLDQPYLTQLWNSIKGILTFNLGSSFTGNEEVVPTISRKFPVTFMLAAISLVLALLIALPIGIFSAVRPNSLFDHSFMFVALLGLSIPNFWQGLVLILNFSIHLGWLPATYSPNNALSFVMPVFVLGTGLTAAVARMTRSSTLEVIHEDYIMTARAKGLNRRQVLMKHAVRNALIPIITVVGLQFGAMLGGAAVTEKVFNISGLGSYIVDRQFIPDIPAIMGGVVYTAITISLVNVIVDVMYAFIDPRIRTRMKHY
ncbi:ABC transporter permease subunit [Paenibacillus sp. P96]|uniref:ABC transporter permease subunit n=1 Tax=Paenibacillus zeirhizosphaerae TaxID=2987519 RepID=A0ABT9FVC5_9BACL|nr:ABC transporter permease subunit [Paenibacillus sp. P96]MDP4098692.1 ABC transporter permease subunit [Paenibacillus sp. P96]